MVNPKQEVPRIKRRRNKRRKDISRKLSHETLRQLFLCVYARPPLPYNTSLNRWLFNR
jgi:hypothetical protein